MQETAKNKVPWLLSLLAEARNLPPLTEAQKNKLRHLSVVTLAAKVKVSDSPASPKPESTCRESLGVCRTAVGLLLWV